MRYAFRMFARNPASPLVVVLTLALGIGANTAIFSLIDALMLRWLPVRIRRSSCRSRCSRRTPRMPGRRSFSYAIVRALAEQRDIFAASAGFSGFPFDVGSPVSVSRVPGALVTGGYYETLGLNPPLGRLLTPADDEPGAPLVAVISDGYWERQFARSRRAVGQTMLINGCP